MKPPRFELTPEVSPQTTVHVDDERKTAHADEDLIEIGITMEPHGGISVTLSLDELVELRDALTRVIDRPVD